jgi:hypothetical protein
MDHLYHLIQAATMVIILSAMKATMTSLLSRQISDLGEACLQALDPDFDH